MTRRPHGVLIGAGYLAGVVALAVVLLALAAPGAIDPFLVAVVAIPLGPLGFVGGFVVVVLLNAMAAGTTSTEPLLAVDGVVLGAVACVGLTNLLLARRRLRRLRRIAVPVGYRSRLPFAWDRLLGRWTLLTAATLFVLICVLAGFAAITAFGVDVSQPAARVAAVQAVAAAAWLVGLVAAVTGLALWVRSERRGARLLPAAVADLAAQLTALIALVVLLAP